MNQHRKKSQTVVEKKNHINSITKENNTIESLESQSLDPFCVEGSEKELFMQRMGQLLILSTKKNGYILKNYKVQSRMTFHGKHRKISFKTQVLDSFALKQKEKPKFIIERTIYFKFYSKPKNKIFIEEHLDSLICPKLIKPIQLQNIHSFLIERKKRFENLIETLNKFKLPAAGKFFEGHPILKRGGNFEFEILKIKAPLITEKSSNLFIPLKPKKIRYTDIDIITAKSINITYIINKIKVFLPTEIFIKNTSNLFIPEKPKKIFYENIEIEIDKTINVNYNIIPKVKIFTMTSIENIEEIFIPEQPKKRYYSKEMIDNITLIGPERPEFCLEIDPSEELFIPNIYDMLLVQNYWDDLSVESFDVYIRPRRRKSKRNLTLFIPNTKDVSISIDSINEDNKENNNGENKEINKDKKEENEINKDILKDFSEIMKNENRIKEKEAKNIDSGNNDDTNNNTPKFSNIKGHNKDKENKVKSVSFNLKETNMKVQNE